MTAGAYSGPERRHSSPAEREVYARERTAEIERDLLHPRRAAIRAAAKVLARIPRSIYILVTLTAATAYGRQVIDTEVAFRTNILAHINRGETAILRLSAVEILSQTTAAELRETRIDMLTFYGAWAAARGDEQMVAYFAARRRKLEDGVKR